MATHKILTLALFDSEAAADAAADGLKHSGAAKHDAIGILALDDEGKIKMHKVGARSTAAGAGIGAVLWLLGPVGAGVGVVAGGLLGALHHKGLGLKDEDQARITKELENGRAAVGVLTLQDDWPAVADYLKGQGGTTDTYEAPDEAMDHAAKHALTS